MSISKVMSIPRLKHIIFEFKGLQTYKDRMRQKEHNVITYYVREQILTLNTLFLSNHIIPIRTFYTEVLNLKSFSRFYFRNIYRVRQWCKRRRVLIADYHGRIGFFHY